VYVRPFPEAGGGKWQVSSGGGNSPLWSHDGKSLFFETLDDRIMEAGYTVSGVSFSPGKPRLWSDKQLISPIADGNYDIAPDGTIEGLVASPPSEESKTSLHVTFLLNFFDELRRRTSQVK
jgi:hypothetical protein